MELKKLVIDRVELEQSIAWMEDLKRYCEEQELKKHVGYLQTAIETCQAFWCEYFEEDTDDE